MEQLAYPNGMTRVNTYESSRDLLSVIDSRRPDVYKRQPEQGSYLNAAETALVGAFRAVQPPVEIFLHPCRMQGLSLIHI